MPARTLAASERLSSCALFQWHASSAATVASVTSPSRSGRASSAVAMRGVQRGVLAREQVAVDRLADQRVAERVHAALIDHEHLVGDRLARALHHLGGGEAGDGLDELVRRGAVEHGGDAHDRARGLRSCSTRASSTSRSVSGSSQLSPCSIAASSSSV